MGDRQPRPVKDCRHRGVTLAAPPDWSTAEARASGGIMDATGGSGEQ